MAETNHLNNKPENYILSRVLNAECLVTFFHHLGTKSS